MSRLVPRREMSELPTFLESMSEPLRSMRDLLRWDPFREWDRPLSVLSRDQFIPRFDVKETADHFELIADLPGIRQEDLDISVTDNRMTISGKREHEEKEEGETYFSVERNFGSFCRSFTLPQNVDVSHVDANYENGVLQISVPKLSESRARKIEIKGKPGAPAMKAAGKNGQSGSASP